MLNQAGVCSNGLKVLPAISIVLLVFLVSVVPSVKINALEGAAETGKFFVFAYITLILSFTFLLKIAVNYKTSIRFTLIDVLTASVYILIIINRAISNHDNFSLRYLELHGLLIVYIMVRCLPPGLYLFLYAGIVLGGIIQAINGHLQLHGYGSRYEYSVFNLTGSFFNPGPYAGYLACTFPVALGCYFLTTQLYACVPILKKPFGDRYFWRKKLSQIMPLISLSGILSILLVIGATKSRAAWAGMILSSALLCFHRYRDYPVLKIYLGNSIKKNVLLAIASFLVIGIGAGMYFYKKASADGRLLIWKVSLGIVKDEPLKGLGFDNFKSAYMRYQAEYFKRNTDLEEQNLADNVWYAFNEPLQLIVENGFLIACLAFVAVLLALKKKVKNAPVLLIAKAGLTSVLVFSLFSYPSHILPISIITVIYGAILAGAYQPLFSFSIPFNRISAFLKLSFLLSALYMLVYSGKCLNKLYGAYENWKLALLLQDTEQSEKPLPFFKKAYPLLKNEGTFLISYGKSLNRAGHYKHAITILNKAKNYCDNSVLETTIGDSYKALKRYQPAEKAYLQASWMIPSHFYPQFLLARLYDDWGRKESARRIASELFVKKAKVESPAIREMLIEMKKIANK